MYHERSIRTLDGLHLYCRDHAGSAQRLPVLCLHGLTRNCQDFAALATRLAPARRVITFDQRGRGRSDHDPNWLNYNFATYIADTGQLLERLELPRVVAIGTSMGGLIAMLMAAANPRAFAGLVLNDVGPEVDPEGLERIRSYVGRQPAVRDWGEAVEQVRSLYGAAFPDYCDAQWLAFARNTFLQDERGAPTVAADPRIGDALRLAFQPPGAAPAMWLAFAAIRSIPMLVIRGERSDLLTARTLERMRREHPRLTALTVPNRGHAPQLDEEACVGAISRFLETLD